MKIQKIDNSQSFGYNKSLNRDLLNRFEVLKQSDNNFTDIIQYTKKANKIEDLLREATKKGDLLWSEIYHTMFLNLKFIVGYCATVFLPNLHYVETEIKDYSDEMEKNHVSPNNGHWLANTVGILSNSKKAAINDFGDDLIPPEDKNAENTDTDIIENVAENAIEDIVLTPKQTLAKYSAATMQLLNCLLDMGYDPDKHVIGISLNMREDFQQAENNTQNSESPNGANEAEEDEIPEHITVFKPTEETKNGFNSLGGMEDLKKSLTNQIVKLLKDKNYADRIYKKYGIKYPAGILFYGPPGCGKTTITECLAVEADVPLLKIKAGTTGSSYIHQTANRIEETFDYAAELAEKMNKPVLVFIDDADALMRARTDSVGSDYRAEEVTTFLDKIQEAASKNVIVIAATNKYDLIDEAGRGRFEQQIYVGLPDKEARKSIFKKFFTSIESAQTLLQDERSMERLVQISEGFPTRDIKMLTQEAKYKAIDENERDLTLEDFEELFAKNQNRKVREVQYKTNEQRGIAGFNLKK